MGSTPLEDAAFVFRPSRSTWPRSNRTKLQEAQSHKPRTVKSADALEPSDRAYRGGSVGPARKEPRANGASEKAPRRAQRQRTLPASETPPPVRCGIALTLARAVRAGGRAETSLSGSRARERAAGFRGASLLLSCVKTARAGTASRSAPSRADGVRARSRARARRKALLESVSACRRAARHRHDAERRRERAGRR